MNHREPLWMPRGSVRAILALMLIGTMCVLVIANRIDVAVFAGLAVVALNAYFEGRRRPGQ
jgi:hypothetical protein